MGVELINDTANRADQTTTKLLNNVVDKLQNMLDTVVAPEKRAEWWERIKEFAVANPKMAAFLFINMLLSGPPLFLFISFTITVSIASLLAALVVAVFAALLFIGFILLVALFVVLPTLFLTTMAATCTVAWGIGVVYIIQWFNEGKRPAEASRAIGGSLNSMSGGRLTWAMDTLRVPVQESATRFDDTVNTLTSEGDNVNGSSDTSFPQATFEKAPAVKPVEMPIQVVS